MGDHRLMSKELENTGKRGPGGRRNNGRTAWQRIFGYLASRGTGTLPPPHLTPGPGIAQYVREGGCRFMTVWRRPNTGRGREKRKRRARF